jgi:methylated-DNA-protein-cysteine methyltransferase-like protein
MPTHPTHKTVTSVSYHAIYAVVDRIPEGRVATYGQVASLAGLPGRARLVGYALNALAGRSVIPWHRVVNAQGRVSPRSGGSGADMEQRLRLEHEGVGFDAGGRIPLDRFLWRPQLAGKGVLIQHEEK